MKKLWILFSVFCFLTLAPVSFGQTYLNQSITVSSVKSVVDDFTFLSVKSVRNDKTKEMELIEGVSFKSKKFEFFGTNKAIYNEVTKKMTVYNCQYFTIDGKLVLKNSERLGSILEYTIGDDKMYLS